MADYKLIAADIDGTLLNSKGELTDRTITAVRAAVLKGIYFVLSTGRPYQGVTKIVEKLGLENMPYILYNGAMVMAGGKVIDSTTIDPAVSAEVVDEGHRRNSTMICWSKNKLYSEFIDEKIIFYKSISGVEPVVVRSLADVAERGITKFVWCDGIEATERNYAGLKERFSGRLNVAPSRVDFLEFFDISCSKAAAMQTVCNELGLTAKDCVSIGDGFNDLPMLEFAGLGVAMANAAPEIKNRCGYITASCDDDGVAGFIEKFVL